MRRSTSSSPPEHAPWTAALALGAVVLLAGCQKALFPEDSPRTQFELQDRMRGRYVPLEEPDVFGRPQPALRARLLED